MPLNPDVIPAMARTLVPLIVGPLAAKYALQVDQADVVLAVSTLLGFGYYVLVRVAESRFPEVGWLLGVAKRPGYGKALDTPPFPPKETAAESVLAVAVDVPVQTDNSPKPEDGPQDVEQPVVSFTGEMR